MVAQARRLLGEIPSCRSVRGAAVPATLATPAVLIFTPIFLPVMAKLGMDPIHFGIVMIFNLCIGLCTPPVGSVLFVGCGVGGTTIAKVWRPLLPFFFAMVLVLIAVTYWPALSLALPRALGF